MKQTQTYPDYTEYISMAPAQGWHAQIEKYEQFSAHEFIIICWFMYVLFIALFVWHRVTGRERNAQTKGHLDEPGR